MQEISLNNPGSPLTSNQRMQILATLGLSDVASQTEVNSLGASLAGLETSKQDKDTDAVAGNFARMSASGNAEDSGFAPITLPVSIPQQTAIDALSSSKANIDGSNLQNDSVSELNLDAATRTKLNSTDGSFQGFHDASGAAPSTVGLVANESYFRISVAGNGITTSDIIVYNGGSAGDYTDYNIVPQTIVPDDGSIDRVKISSSFESDLSKIESDINTLEDTQQVFDRPDFSYGLVAEDFSLISQITPDGVETHYEREIHLDGSITSTELAGGGTSGGSSGGGEVFDRPDLAYAITADDYSGLLIVNADSTLEATPANDFIDDVNQIAQSVRDALGGGVKILGTPSIGSITKFLEFDSKTGINGTWETLPDIKTRSVSVHADDSINLQLKRNNLELLGKEYEGTWDASTGETPAPLTLNSFKRGMWWRVSGAGTVDNIAYAVDDIIVYEALNDDTSNFPYTDPVSLDGGDPAKRFRLIQAANTGNYLFLRSTWDASMADPIEFSTALDGYCWECITSDTRLDRDWHPGDFIIKDSTEDLGYRIVPYSAPIALNSDALHPKTPTVLPCSESASEWQINRADGGVDPVFVICEAMHEETLFAYVVQDGNDRKIYIENGFTGKIDTLATLNASVDNFDPLLKNNRLYFTSNRNGSDEQFYAYIHKTPYGVDAQDVRPLRPDRFVYTGGDSMSFQSRNFVAAGINAYDSANNQPARSYHHAGRGSFDPFQITDRFFHWRSLLDGSVKLGDAHQVIFLDRSTQNATRAEAFKLVSEITAGIKHLIIIGLFGELRYTFNSTELVAAEGKGTEEFRKVVELERFFTKQFGRNFINARELMAGGNDPNPLHPGSTNQEIYDQLGYYAPRYCKRNLGSVTTLQDNPSALTAARFRGYTTSATPPAAIGDEVVFDYQIRTTGGLAATGDLYIWNGSSYDNSSLDRLHLDDAGYTLVGDEVAIRFGELGWV